MLLPFRQSCLFTILLTLFSHICSTVFGDFLLFQLFSYLVQNYILLRYNHLIAIGFQGDLHGSIVELHQTFP